MTRLVKVLWLAVIWVALWSDVSLGNVVGGLLLGAVVVLLFDTWRAGTIVFRPIAILKFAGYFLAQMAISTVTVAIAVVSPSHRVRTGIIAVPLRGCSDAVATVVADAISLTPGTLTLEVRRDPLTLYVHALDVRDVAATRRTIRTLEVLAVKAFGDGAAIEGLAVDDTEVLGAP